MAKDGADKASIFSESVLLAAVPALGTMLAAVFDAGYLIFFNISLDHIEISAARIAAGSCVVLIPATASILLARPVESGGLRKKWPVLLLFPFAFCGGAL